MLNVQCSVFEIFMRYIEPHGQVAAIQKAVITQRNQLTLPYPIVTFAPAMKLLANVLTVVRVVVVG